MDEQEVRILIKHCFLQKKNSVEAKEWFDKHYSDSAPGISTVEKWFAKFRTGHMSTEDDEYSGLPNETKKKTRQPPKFDNSRLCDICGMDFSSTESLKNHKLIHSDDMLSHMCATCGKRFKRLTNLKIHENIHNGNKPYKCESCPYSSACRSNLNSHVKQKHSLRCRQK